LALSFEEEEDTDALSPCSRGILQIDQIISGKAFPELQLGD
jgi:hypothetical protein